MTFGQAVENMKEGARAQRAGWNGKGMWIAMTPGSVITDPSKFWSPANKRFAAEERQAWEHSARASEPWPGIRVLPMLTMKTATGEILVGWLASQTDILADDWDVLP